MTGGEEATDNANIPHFSSSYLYTTCRTWQDHQQPATTMIEPAVFTPSPPAGSADATMMTHEVLGSAGSAPPATATTTAIVHGQLQAPALQAPAYTTGHWAAGWPADQQQWQDQAAIPNMMLQDRSAPFLHSSPLQADTGLFPVRQQLAQHPAQQLAHHPAQQLAHHPAQQLTQHPAQHPGQHASPHAPQHPSQFMDSNQKRGVYYYGPGGEVKLEAGHMPGDRPPVQGLQGVYPGPVQSPEQEAIACWRRQCCILEAATQRLHSQNLTAHTELEEVRGQLQRALKYTEAYKADVLVKEQDWKNKMSNYEDTLNDEKKKRDAEKAQLTKCNAEKVELAAQLNLVKSSFANQATTIQDMARASKTTSDEVDKYRAAMITVVGLMQPQDQDRAKLYFPEQFPALEDDTQSKNPIGPYLVAALNQAEKKPKETIVKVAAPEEHIKTMIVPRIVPRAQKLEKPEKHEQPESSNKADHGRRTKNVPQKVSTKETVRKKADEDIEFEISPEEKSLIEDMDEDEKDDDDQNWKRAKKR